MIRALDKGKDPIPKSDLEKIPDRKPSLFDIKVHGIEAVRKRAAEKAAADKENPASATKPKPASKAGKDGFAKESDD